MRGLGTGRQRTTAWKVLPYTPEKKRALMWKRYSIVLGKLAPPSKPIGWKTKINCIFATVTSSFKLKGPSHFYVTECEKNWPTFVLTMQLNPHTATSGVLRSRELFTWNEIVTASPSTLRGSFGHPICTTPLLPAPCELPPNSATLRPFVLLPAYTST